MNPWKPDMNKNQVRDNLRKHIQSGGFLDTGVDRIVDQVVNPKIYTVFLPKVEEVVHSCLGMNSGKPVFEPPPPPEVKPEPSEFQNKHNLVTRTRISTPSLVPILPPVSSLSNPKPIDHPEGKDQPEEKKVHSPEMEETSDRSYVVDEDDDNAEDDEESPPFEHHTENDRLILGVHTDSSDSVSNDSQVVTTIVDDNLEERIDNSDKSFKEENVGNEIKREFKEENVGNEIKREDESSSDEYVPKTPTINMEGSDGTVIEFNSISEYKQYQAKYDEESLQNVQEEVFSSQWLDESSNPPKEESIKYESEVFSRKRTFTLDNYDTGSNSSIDKGSVIDEGKFSTNIFSDQKKVKTDEDDQSFETVSEFNSNENDDSNPEKPKLNELKENFKTTSNIYKESGKSHHHGGKDYRSSCHQSTSSKVKSSDKEYRGSSSSSTHSSKDKKDNLIKDDKHNSSRDQNKERDRKKYESLTNKHYDRDKYKHNEKDKEKNSDKKKEVKTDTDNKSKGSIDKDKKEYTHDHKSRDNSDKEKRKHENLDKSLEEKLNLDSSHRHENDKRDHSKSSKHSHSSSRHSHKSSSEKHKSVKDHKSRQQSEKLTSHDKKSEKQDSKKKSREHCKSHNKDNEGRRSTDRDSNGPSGKSQSYSLSSSTTRSTSRYCNDTTSGTGNKTTSNSDNTVSDNIETLQNEDKFDIVSENGIASPDPEPYEDSYICSGSEFYNSKEDLMETSFESNDENCIGDYVHESNKTDHVKTEDANEELIDLEVVNFNETQSKQPEKEQYKDTNYLDESYNVTGDVLQNLEENICVENNDLGENYSNPAGSNHDISSEKENIEQPVNCKELCSNKETLKVVNHKEAKFKKPKIAANIYEVKKIMQARRNLKRMEKKRMKLITNNNSDICKTEKTPFQNSVEKPLDENFAGFESATSQKIEIYDCLMKRLNDEIDLITPKDEISPNLITSLIEMDPEFDYYIENVLRGKVHRKMRVRLPPICDEYYTFDIEHNAYILKDDTDASTSQKELVDNNLNHVNSISPNLERCVSDLNEVELHQSTDTFNGCKRTSRHRKANSPSKSSVYNLFKVHSQFDGEEINSSKNNSVTDMVDSTCKPSTQLISDGNGVHQTTDSTVQVNQRRIPAVERRSQRNQRQQGQRVQQCYDSSDLYKPRLQLSRKGRGESSPNAILLSQLQPTRKRHAVTEEEATTGPKRKR